MTAQYTNIRITDNDHIVCDRIAGGWTKTGFPMAEKINGEWVAIHVPPAEKLAKEHLIALNSFLANKKVD